MENRRIHNFYSKFARTSLASLATVAFSTALLAPSSNGIIHGQVTDSSGAIVPGAEIVVHSPAVGGSFRAVSDKEGNYRLGELPEGSNYSVEVAASGFQKFVRGNLLVRPGLDIAVDAPLTLGSAQQVVEVTGDAPLIDTQNAEQSVNLSGELLRSVPITGRHDWSDSLQLTPGIVSASSDAQGGQTYFLRGSENENHVTLYDGMDIGSFQQNWPSNGISISNESLGDVQIITGGNDATSPAAMGMVINLASPAGSDQFHGSLFYLAGPSSFNANNVPGGAAASTAVQQPDFAIGGPIKRQRAWFSPLAVTSIVTTASVRRTRKRDILTMSRPAFKIFPTNRVVLSFSVTSLCSFHKSTA